MYRYDEFDHAFVQRAGRAVPRPGRAPALGRARRGAVQAAPAAERRLPAAPRLHAPDRRPLRHAQPAPDAPCSPTSRATTTRATATSPRGRTCSSTGRALKDVPDILAKLADGRDALHPDLRQLHPQRHRRPFRRRRRRRGRRPAALCRDPAAVVVAPPGIPVPAAEIQDRGDRRAGRPRGDPVPRHRLRGEAQRRRASSASPSISAAAWAARPMLGKKIRDFLPEEDLLAYSEAILRVYNLYGRRDNKFKARIKILVHETGVEDDRARRSRRSSRRTATACCACPRKRSAASPPISRRRPMRTRPGRERRRSSARALADPAFDRWVAPQRRAATACRATPSSRSR